MRVRCEDCGENFADRGCITEIQGCKINQCAKCYAKMHGGPAYKLVEPYVADWIAELNEERDRIDRQRYLSYLRSPQWRDLTARLRERSNYTCAYCGRSEEVLGRKLQGHHISYEYLGQGGELELGTLAAACKNCHQLLHFGSKNKKKKGTH